MRSPHTTTKSSPCLPQIEKARAQQQRPNAAKKKEIEAQRGNMTCLGSHSKFGGNQDCAQVSRGRLKRSGILIIWCM